MTDLSASSLRALKLMDLTTLNDDDTNEKVIALCHQAKTPVGNTAAICIYPRFIPIARKTLNAQGTPDIRIATVTNFPHGNDDIDIALAETRAAIAYGADEVDVVFPYRALIAGNEQVGFDLVKACKEACAAANVLLKVIIETGELKEEALIRKASEISIKAGADFIKTSTGKVPVNATPEIHQRVVDPRQRGINGQHHKRQIGVNNADIDRQVGMQDLQRLVDDPQPQQEVIQHAVAFQQPHPRINADQE